MKVEIWSDVVCPWCYIGKRRFESALASFEAKEQVEVVWRSFELDPVASTTNDEEMAVRLSRKYRMSEAEARESMANMTKLASDEGLVYHLDSTKSTNSLDAHRLLHLGSLNGLNNQMKERLLKAYFTDNLDISNRDVLVSIGAEIGLDTGEIREMYASDYLTAQVRSDEALAAQYGINGVPYFVFDGKYGVSGAQPKEVFLQVMNKVLEDALVQIRVSGNSSELSCSDDSCVI